MTLHAEAQEILKEILKEIFQMILHWCLFCQYLFGIYSVKVISTEKWCLE